MKPWLRVALVAAVTYLVIGVAFAVFAGWASSGTMGRAWRLAAWAVSGVVFVAQIWYEHFRLRGSSAATALHACIGAALGAFGLAVWAMAHSWLVGSGHLPGHLLALVVWPLVTAVPAFVVALAITMAMARVARSVS